MRSRALRTAVALAATGVVVALVSAGSSASPVAHLAKNCPIGTGEEFHGYTYVTAIAESGTTCSAADGLIKAHGHQRGWKCTTKRGQSNQFQYMASTTCTNGARKVIWNFSENT
jgi:hypothetical protein